MTTLGPCASRPSTATSFFPSRHRHCPKCCRRKVTVGGEEVTEYYHRGVVCHLIGFDIAVPLDVEMIRPGEGEVPAARRLLERVFRDYPRFFDAIVADAIYLQGPFFDFCLSHGKHVVAVLKGNNPALLEDAKGLFQNEAPRTARDGKRTIEYWDAEGFTSASGIDAPVRVVHTLETETKRERIAGKWEEKTAIATWWWATTIPQEIMPARQVWQAGHGRWGIENELFNTLVTYWSLNHCFHHNPAAIENFILTLLIAFVLIQSFYLRNLKAPLRARLSLIAIASQLYLGLATLAPWRAPWLGPVAGLPP